MPIGRPGKLPPRRLVTGLGHARESEINAVGQYRGEQHARSVPHAPGPTSLGCLAGRSDRLAVFLGLHGDGINIANIFNGLWLVPFGILVMRSGFIPRILGILLIADCCALVAVSLTALLLPAYLDIVSRVAIIPELGELWMMAWLLIKGVREQPLPAAGVL